MGSGSSGLYALPQMQVMLESGLGCSLMLSGNNNQIRKGNTHRDRTKQAVVCSTSVKGIRGNGFLKRG